MGTFKKKVKDILWENFGERAVKLENHLDGRIRGAIVSEKFIGKDELARQHRIWALLRKNLTKSELSQVLGFLAYTPEEKEAYSNGVAYDVHRKPIKGFEKKIKGILSERFAENELLLETESEGRVSGFIISNKFADVDELERQHMIWGVLQSRITEAERRHIIGFLTFTPREHKAYTSYREAS